MSFNCTVVSCIRQIDPRGIKSRANYQIEETCHYAKENICTYRKKEVRYYGKEKKEVLTTTSVSNSTVSVEDNNAI